MEVSAIREDYIMLSIDSQKEGNNIYTVWEDGISRRLDYAFFRQHVFRTDNIINLTEIWGRGLVVTAADVFYGLFLV